MLVDSIGWLGGDIAGRKLLCLGAGGGKHAALYAAAGADVTVVDISAGQLELDRQVAIERKLELKTVEASMDHMPMFAAGEFEIVIHPVSTCYVPRIEPVYQEVARITQPGGLYISQHKTPTSLQADTHASANGYELLEPYYHSGPLPPVIGSPHREEGTLEYLHRWEDLIGGLCRCGFVLEDLRELTGKTSRLLGKIDTKVEPLEINKTSENLNTVLINVNELVLKLKSTAELLDTLSGTVVHETDNIDKHGVGTKVVLLSHTGRGAGKTVDAAGGLDVRLKVFGGDAVLAALVRILC